MKIKPRSAISSTVIVVVIVVVILIAAAGVYVAVSAKPASTVTVTSGTTATVTSGTTATVTSGTTATVTTTSSSTATLSKLSPPVSVTITVSSSNVSYLDDYVAANGGFCSQLGLDATYVPSASSTAESEELASNEVQFGDAALTSALTFLNSSVPITGVGVGFGSGLQGAIFSVAISNKSTITSMAQLKGTGFTIAGSGPGAADLAMRLIAQQYGLTVGTAGSGADIIDIDAGSSAAATAALVSGAVQGADNAWTSFIPYQVAGDVKILANYSNPQNLIVATNTLIAHSPNVVSTFLQCYYDAAAYLAKNETYAIQMANQMFPGTFTNQELQSIYTTMYTNANTSLPRNGAFTPLVLQMWTSYRAAYIAAPGDGSLPPLSEMYTTQFVPVTLFNQIP